MGAIQSQGRTKIAILGSCVSRDAFEISWSDDYDVVEYIARNSLTVMTAPPERDDAVLNAISSPFQRRMVAHDLDKSAIQSLLLVEYDWLLLDFIDDRFDVQRFPSGHLRSLSPEYLSGIKGDPAKTDIIRFGSDEHFALWKAGLDHVLGTLHHYGRSEQVVINRVFWATHQVNGAPVFASGNGAVIRKANDVLTAMYRYIAENYPELRWINYPRHVSSQTPITDGDSAHIIFTNSSMSIRLELLHA